MIKYERKRLLGEASTQGRVYEVQNIETKKLLAMKMRLDIDDAKKESENLQKLQHSPYICKIHETFLYKSKGDL